MNRTLVIAVAVVVGWFAFTRTKAPVVEAAPAAVLADVPSERQPPLQRDVDRSTAFRVNGYELNTLAQFAVTARVLSTERYRVGREAELSPIDLALGWGRMSDSAVVERLSISQSGRWYHWRYSGSPPIPHREIETSSANMPLIPASPEVTRVPDNARKGSIVVLKGYLVEARGKDGWSWRSSLTRDDTGNGTCEVMFVQSAEVR